MRVLWRFKGMKAKFRLGRNLWLECSPVGFTVSDHEQVVFLQPVQMQALITSVHDYIRAVLEEKASEAHQG